MFEAPMSPESSVERREAQAAPSTVAAPKNQDVALPCFDGLRAVALTLVFSYHAFILLRPTAFGAGARLWWSQSGTTALTMFFVISGCLLYRPFVLAHFESRKPPRGGAFLKRRFTRIFPAYWLALSVAVYGLGIYTIATFGDFATLYGLVQNYRVGYLKAGLNVSWTLVIEVAYYLSLPLLAWMLRWPSRHATSLKRKFFVQLVGLSTIYLGVHALRAYLLWSERPETGPYGSWFSWQRFLVYPLSYYDWLALGMILAVVSAWIAVGQELPAWIESLGKRPWVSWLLAIAVYWLIVCLGITPTSTSPARTMGLVFLQGVVASFVVLPGVIGPQDRGLLRKFLRSRVMGVLGAISYGVYLWHLTFLKKTGEWTSAGFIFDNILVELAVAAGLTVGAAAISYYAMELPLIHWAQSKRSKSVGPTPGG